ncbi:Galectin-8 [Manis javanica]|nr:Galectin-8 [Manis javanica]
MCKTGEFADLAPVLENRASSSQELPNCCLPCSARLRTPPGQSPGVTSGTEGQPWALQQSNWSSIKARCQTVTFHQNSQQPSLAFHEGSLCREAWLFQGSEACSLPWSSP